MDNPENRPLELARTRKAFLSHMKHELRTPINAIVGYSEMLLEEKRDDGSSFVSDLKKIHARGLSLVKLVDQALDPSKLEVEKADLELFATNVRLDLRTPLNDIIGYCELLLEDTQTQGRHNVTGELQRIHSASLRLLAMIDDIVNLLQIQAGKMDLDLADLNKSSMIRSVVAAVRPLSENENNTRPGERGEPGRILIVDDNDVNRELLCRRLQREGHEAAAAENGRRALEMVRTEKFDLILLDLMMPEINGYEVLENLKADPALRDMPVIMISALDEFDSVIRCIEKGAEDYLAKPFDPILLKARIDSSLEKKRLRDRQVSYLQQIEAEKKRADDLLHVIFPEHIVRELQTTNRVTPRRREKVAVLFADIVGFTSYCEVRQPEDVVLRLQQWCEAFEEITLRHGLQKIKTVGDAFMAAGGLMDPSEECILSCVKCGLEMVSSQRMAEWRVRVGIHAGPAVTGVVGNRQYSFDLWGDTVNTASRIESHGTPDAVNVSAIVWEQVSTFCRGESLGVVRLKGKGEMEIFRIDGLAE